MTCIFCLYKAMRLYGSQHQRGAGSGQKTVHWIECGHQEIEDNILTKTSWELCEGSWHSCWWYCRLGSWTCECENPFFNTEMPWEQAKEKDQMVALWFEVPVSLLQRVDGEAMIDVNWCLCIIIRVELVSVPNLDQFDLWSLFMNPGFRCTLHKPQTPQAHVAVRTTWVIN